MVVTPTGLTGGFSRRDVPSRLRAPTTGRDSAVHQHHDLVGLLQRCPLRRRSPAPSSRGLRSAAHSSTSVRASSALDTSSASTNSVSAARPAPARAAGPGRTAPPLDARPVPPPHRSPGRRRTTERRPPPRLGAAGGLTARCPRWCGQRARYLADVGDLPGPQKHLRFSHLDPANASGVVDEAAQRGQP